MILQKYNYRNERNNIILFRFQIFGDWNKVQYILEKILAGKIFFTLF